MVPSSTLQGGRCNLMDVQLLTGMKTGIKQATAGKTELCAAASVCSHRQTGCHLRCCGLFASCGVSLLSCIDASMHAAVHCRVHGDLSSKTFLIDHSHGSQRLVPLIYCIRMQPPPSAASSAVCDQQRHIHGICNGPAPAACSAACRPQARAAYECICPARRSSIAAKADISNCGT